MPLSVTAAPTAASRATPAGPARAPSSGDGGFADVLAGQVDDQLTGRDVGNAAAVADPSTDPSTDLSAPDDAEAGPADDALVALDAAAIAEVAALPAQPAVPAAARPDTATAEPSGGVARSSSRVRHGWSLASTTSGASGTATGPTPATGPMLAAAPTPAVEPALVTSTGPAVAGALVAGPAAPSAGPATPLTPLTPPAPDSSGSSAAAGIGEPATSVAPPMLAAPAAAVAPQVAAPLPLVRGTGTSGEVVASDAGDASVYSNPSVVGVDGNTGDDRFVPPAVAPTDGAASAAAPVTRSPRPSMGHAAGAPLERDATGSPAVPGPDVSAAAASTAAGAVAPGQVPRTEPGPAEPGPAVPDAPVSATAPSGVPSPPLQAASAPTTAAPAAPPSAPAPPLVEQLVPRLVKVPGLGEGVHRLTLDVRPEAIGSVTVVAHIRADSVRIELVGATAAAHEALRGVLADLRRDLAATGSNASLDLGTATGSGAGGDVGAGTGSRGERPAAAGAPWLRSPDAAGATTPVEASSASRLKAAAGRVDVLA